MSLYGEEEKIWRKAPQIAAISTASLPSCSCYGVSGTKQKTRRKSTLAQIPRRVSTVIVHNNCMQRLQRAAKSWLSPSPCTVEPSAIKWKQNHFPTIFRFGYGFQLCCSKTIYSDINTLNDFGHWQHSPNVDFPKLVQSIAKLLLAVPLPRKEQPGNLKRYPEAFLSMCI